MFDLTMNEQKQMLGGSYRVKVYDKYGNLLTNYPFPSYESTRSYVSQMLKQGYRVKIVNEG